MGDDVVPNVGFSNKGLNEEKESEKEYPYCLRIYLGPEELKNLGINELPNLGVELDLLAKAKVVELRSDEKHGNTMTIQITDMAVKSSEKKKDTAELLYGG